MIEIESHDLDESTLIYDTHWTGTSESDIVRAVLGKIKVHSRPRAFQTVGASNAVDCRILDNTASLEYKALEIYTFSDGRQIIQHDHSPPRIRIVPRQNIEPESSTNNQNQPCAPKKFKTKIDFSRIPITKNIPDEMYEYLHVQPFKEVRKSRHNRRFSTEIRNETRPQQKNGDKRQSTGNKFDSHERHRWEAKTAKIDLVKSPTSSLNLLAQKSTKFTQNAEPRAPLHYKPAQDSLSRPQGQDMVHPAFVSSRTASISQLKQEIPRTNTTSTAPRYHITSAMRLPTGSSKRNRYYRMKTPTTHSKEFSSGRPKKSRIWVRGTRGFFRSFVFPKNHPQLCIQPRSIVKPLQPQSRRTKATKRPLWLFTEHAPKNFSLLRAHLASDVCRSPFELQYSMEKVKTVTRDKMIIGSQHNLTERLLLHGPKERIIQSNNQAMDTERLQHQPSPGGLSGQGEE
jgi:hypothetical protein